MKPTRKLKLVFLLALLFASHLSALQLGSMLREPEVRALEQRAEFLQETILRSRQRTVKVSAYSASKEECDDDPHIAASMKPPRPGTVAVSRDLFKMGWTFGKRTYLNGMGSYVINDVMNPRHQMQVDVFMDHKRAAREFGVRTTEAILL